jgi:4-hydroxyphenylpyruvate dioxygenase
MRIAYEALAWGRHVNTWNQSWDIVRLGDHPALGLCLDSFHVLSRTPEPEAISPISEIPGDKIFFLQLADAPLMKHGRAAVESSPSALPRPGEFDLPRFVDHVLTAGYAGPLSLEVFNDVFRQSAPVHTAVDALRSLLVLEESVARDRRRKPWPSDSPAHRRCRHCPATPSSSSPQTLARFRRWPAH